jgi:hypothetical protein
MLAHWIRQGIVTAFLLPRQTGISCNADHEKTIISGLMAGFSGKWRWLAGM